MNENLYYVFVFLSMIIFVFSIMLMQYKIAFISVISVFVWNHNIKKLGERY